ncbi:hypothetical protein [Paenibacillus xerothermodurans]|uniref:Uncharacterized protein n=1 Tax=Paenibacillus xerothermodurans TaxID=1977292 RepID=A0A2W1NHI0_PAEXE|nr:hypothetical protein [Paenibacillus xerothermodurans]PZE22591.1 hypothetical protein CBW46_002095 [Paenibacillus xerothermodurans]
MTTEILFHDQKIPVRFISSDQKAIPLLIQSLERNRTQPARVEVTKGREAQINLIELVGNCALLYTSAAKECIRLPLY